MRRVWVSPAKYIQGPNEMANLGFFVKEFGTKALLVGTVEDIARVQGVLDQTASTFGVEFIPSYFSGAATVREVARLRKLVASAEIDCVVGLGGGRALDVAKTVAQGKNLIVVPTIAASDAATSNLAVLYHDDGTFEGYHSYAFNPSVVLVDSQVILNAPPRFLVAGMGDALATYYEAEQAWRSFGDTQAGKICGSSANCGSRAPLAALAVAKSCRDTILMKGVVAKRNCLEKKLSNDFEDVLEANTLLSGLGFENGGLAAAHGVQDGLTLLAETHHLLHGEKVAFCLLVQLVLEKRNGSEIQEIADFMQEVGLPVNLSDLGLRQVTNEQLRKVAEYACLETEPTHNMVEKITPTMILGSILQVDEWFGEK